MHEMFKIPDIILTPSSFVRDQFLKYYSFIGSKTRVLPLGIPPVNGGRGKRIQNGKTRFCYFGNILPLKGVHILIDAFKALPKGKSALTIYGERNPWTGAYYER
jgi:glycosyltransferase involved in cell wall biosynthesis